MNSGDLKNLLTTKDLASLRGKAQSIARKLADKREMKSNREVSLAQPLGLNPLPHSERENFQGMSNFSESYTCTYKDTTLDASTARQNAQINRIRNKVAVRQMHEYSENLLTLEIEKVSAK
jgi:hypothetical protein